MAVTESFLVNTNSFNAIIEALIDLEEAPEEISDDLLVSLGFDSPSDLLVVHMLKELHMVSVEGEPTELYHKLTSPDTTDEAIAKGVLQAYGDLFEGNRQFHKLPKEEILDALKDYFEGRKTDLILKYMTNTFHKLVTYAGQNNVQKAVDAYFEGRPEPEESAEEEVKDETEEKISSNGQQQAEEQETDNEDAPEKNTETGETKSDEKEVDVADEIFFGKDEQLDEEDKDEEKDKEIENKNKEESSTGNKNGKINFDELPQVRQEEKGSKNIDDIFGEQQEETEPEEEKETEPVAENEQEELAETEETANHEEEVEETQESLEQELLELNMESTNGLNKNGAETKENPMANLTNIPTNEKVEKALIKKAELLYKLERFEEVLPAYNEVISFFDDSDKEHLKEAVAQAVINRVAVLNKLDKDDELLPALDEVISRFEDSSTTEYYDQASMAMLQKSQLLEGASTDVLLPLYESIIDRLQNASTPKIKNQVDEVFINRVDILMDEGSDSELLNAVDELIDRFEGSEMHTGQLEQAMYKKAEILENLNRDEEALAAYSEFLERFGKTKEAV